MTCRLIAVVCIVLLTSVLGEAPTHPPGHMKPLGSHMEPLGQIEEISGFPSPRTFYEKFVRKSKPFIMRKVLENGDMPAYHKWNDDYLTKVYGDIKVDVESGKLENREGDGVKGMNMKKFIKRYNDLDGYLVTDIPKPMRDDVNLPWSLHCGGFQNNLVSVIMWFSSGGTKSHFHNDGLDNINCLLDGRKDLFMVDKKHKDLVEADFWKMDGAYSRVHVEKVDMYKFPKLQKLPWYNVTIHKGDCLYIPLHWYHHVDSSKGRNLALNFWFEHIFWHNETECDDDANNKKNMFPLNKYEIHSENMDTALKTILFERFEIAGQEHIEFEDFYAVLTNNNNVANHKSEDTESADERDKEQMCLKCFGELDKDKNGVVSWQEVQTVDMDKLVDKYRKVFSIFHDELHNSDDTESEDENNENDEELDENTSSNNEQGNNHEEL